MCLQKKELQARTTYENVFDAIDIAVSQSLRIPVAKIYANDKRKLADTFERKLAMYLAHTFLSIAQATVGKRYNRNRQAVSLACALVENARDDSSMDRRIESIEESLRKYLA